MLFFYAVQSNIYKSFSEEQKNFIDLLEPMNIEARYPTNKKQLMESLTKKRCAEIMKNAEDLQKWIIKKL